MKKKCNIRKLFSVMAAVLCMAAVALPAHADNSGNGSDDDGQPITSFQVDTRAVSVQPSGGGDETVQFHVSYESGQNIPDELLTAFTPDGNLSLIDDFSRVSRNEDGEIETKQFITVQSKAGNYFYIVIDRAGDAENVYFMNLVDEADLMALTESGKDAEKTAPAVCDCKDKCRAGHVNTACPVCAVDMTKCDGKEPAPEPEPEPTPDAQETPVKQNTGSPLVALILILALCGGAAYYFFKLRGKPQTKGGDDLEDYDYGAEDGEEYEFEQSNAETGAPETDAEDGA